MRNANEPDRRIAPGTTGGVLDTIADGLTFVLEHPRIMILPLVVDLVLWLFIHVSLAPLANNVARFLEDSGTTDADLAAEGLRDIGARVQVSDGLGAFLPSLFSGLPLDSFLNVLVTTMSPNMGLGIDREAIYETWERGLLAAWTPDSAGVVALIGLGCLVVGTLLLVLYRVPMARAVRGDTTSRLMPEIGKAWMHFIAYLVLMAVAVVIAMVPLFLATMVLLILGFNLVFIMVMALFIFGGMVSISTLFTVDAMLLHRIGPIQALRMSWSVGRVNFAQTSRFALTSLLFLMGSLHLWSRMVETMPGIAIALVVNAFIGTGLSFASMLFYSDRFRLIRTRQRSQR